MRNELVAINSNIEQALTQQDKKLTDTVNAMSNRMEEIEDIIKNIHI